MLRVFWFLVLLLSVWALASSGCGQKANQGVLTLRGLVVDVEAASITEVKSLKVRDEQGTLWEFKANGPVGFTPSHLRAHMLQGDPVTVRYRKVDGQLMAIEVAD